MEVSFFKARKAGGGSAVKFNLSDRGGVFITMWPQKGTGEKSFDWDKRVFAALNANEMGEMVAVIEGRIDGVGSRKEEGDKVYYNGFYHSTENSKTTIRFAKYNDGIGVGVKSDRPNATGDYSCVLNIGELYALRELLRGAIIDSLTRNAQWGDNAKGQGSTAPQENSEPVTNNSPPAAKTAPKTGGKKQAPAAGPVAKATSEDEIPF